MENLKTIPKILFVDDELSILSACKRLFRKESIHVDCSSNPLEILKMISQTPYAVVISDQKMPTMTGSQFLAKVKTLLPNSVRILLTGYADINAAIDAINQGAIYRFLTKPWNDKELIQIIKQAIFQYQLLNENIRLNIITKKQNLELKQLNSNLEKKVLERTKKISELNQNLKNSFMGSVNVLSELSEMYSSTLGHHSKRVSFLSTKIGEKLKLPQKELFQLQIAATLHDIGKLGIPPSLLTKDEEKLSKHEIEILKRHAVFGEQIINTVPNLELAALYVKHHHENFNGSGYPDRLAKNNIPIGSRIINIVDAYDKFLNGKNHYKSTTETDALMELRKNSSYSFDPDIISILSQCLRSNTNQNNPEVEIEIKPKDLQRGMILSRDIISINGILLFPKDKELNESHVKRLQQHHQIDPIVDGLFIYRRELKK